MNADQLKRLRPDPEAQFHYRQELAERAKLPLKTKGLRDSNSSRGYIPVMPFHSRYRLLQRLIPSLQGDRLGPTALAS